ncbi:MAG: Cadmium, zinc and cobalt-transporting ATPase [Alphaproteobacteria bacterium ADurb.Bin438]|nr:MAG: Cadmium, zinc and cobalt-transporting ATPase [Alphaproteobacteria bacterium ADurb.Bin438]
MVSVDGVLLSKEAIFDTSSLTGEFKPKYVKQGGEVLSGYILKEGVAEVRATKSYKNSTIYKLIDLIENAALKKSKVEKFMTKFAKIYTPIVVLIAVLMTIIPVFIFKLNPDEWILKSVIFLAVSCPCALVLSIPLTFFNSIGIASKHGILIKGGNYLEGLNNIETIYFDKTGTLSEGAFEIIEIKPFNISEKEFLTKLEMVESLSNHPIAKAICKGCEEQKIDFTYYKEEQGLGIKASVKDKDYMVGSDKFLKLNNINFKEAETIGTKINLVINNEYKGYLVIGDNLKQGAKELVTTLKKDFGKNLIMLSGDNQENVEKVAKELGFDDYYGNLLPDEKLSKIKSKKSMFIGDGVNDAPSIMASSVGLSFSNFSSDITKEASDIVIVSGGLEKIKTLFLIAKHNKKVLTQNIAFVLLVKFLVLIMGSFGYVMIWHAIFADVGVSVLAVINSLKSFKLKEK